MNLLDGVRQKAEDRPLIGVPMSMTRRRSRRAFQLLYSYHRAIAHAGAVPLPIPLYKDELALRAVYNLLDGLLLAGGGDVSPHWYGGPESGTVRSVDERRDRVEIAVSRWALDDALPILGICRGIQVLNVAAGGTLVQDIPHDLPRSLAHASDALLGRAHVAHTVRVTRGSALAIALGCAEQEDDSVGVNSFHHQATRQVAPRFRITAWAPDGVVEGIEGGRPSDGFVLGVQWHPEDMVPDDLAMVHLFETFVVSCAQRRCRAGTALSGSREAV